MSERRTLGAVAVVVAVLVVLGAVVLGLFYDANRRDSAAEGAISTYTPPVGMGGSSAVFIGDSYTAGAGASDLSHRWTSLLSAANFWEETNLGIGSTGYVTSSPDCESSKCGNYQSVVPEAVALDPSVVVVAGGLNDFAAFVEDPASVVNAIYTTIGSLRAGLPDARIIAVGPSSAGEVPPFVTAFDSVVRDAAATAGADFVSLVDPVDVVGEDMLDPDGIHVDDAGHAAIASAVSAGLG